MTLHHIGQNALPTNKEISEIVENVKEMKGNRR
jgi:hypothetical protein